MLLTPPTAGSELNPPSRCPEALQLLANRRSCIATQLREPAPNQQDIDQLLCLAARAPDHGKLSPWRFILLSDVAKQRFCDKLRKLLATAQEQDAKHRTAIGKLEQPPLVITVVSRTTEGRIPVWEQELSAGAVCMNLLTGAHALGYGANWITGWYAYDDRVNNLLGLKSGERIAGYLLVGSIEGPLKERPRSNISELVSVWSTP